MTTFFSDKDNFLISNDLNDIILSSQGYDNLVLLGVDNISKTSFIAEIYSIEQIGYIFYHLNEYSPLINNNYNIILFGGIKLNPNFKQKIIDTIFIYNNHWINKVNLIFNYCISVNNISTNQNVCDVDVNLNYQIGINVKNQDIIYLRQDNYKFEINEKYHHNTFNCR